MTQSETPQMRTVVNLPMACQVVVEGDKVVKVHLMPLMADAGYFGPGLSVHETSHDEHVAEAFAVVDGYWDVSWDEMPEWLRWEA